MKHITGGAAVMYTVLCSKCKNLALCEMLTHKQMIARLKACILGVRYERK